jgi:hypothetical protein
MNISFSLSTIRTEATCSLPMTPSSLRLSATFTRHLIRTLILWYGGWILALAPWPSTSLPTIPTDSTMAGTILRCFQRVSTGTGSSGSLASGPQTWTPKISSALLPQCPSFPWQESTSTTWRRAATCPISSMVSRTSPTSTLVFYRPSWTQATPSIAQLLDVLSRQPQTQQRAQVRTPLLHLLRTPQTRRTRLVLPPMLNQCLLQSFPNPGLAMLQRLLRTL